MCTQQFLDNECDVSIQNADVARKTYTGALASGEPAAELGQEVSGLRGKHASDKWGDGRVSGYDGPAHRECGLICHTAYITLLKDETVG